MSSFCAVFLLSVALQLPEGLQMFACVIADIIERYSKWKKGFSSGFQERFSVWEHAQV